jgi:hypothetical protein
MYILELKGQKWKQTAQDFEKDFFIALSNVCM